MRVGLATHRRSLILLLAAWVFAIQTDTAATQRLAVTDALLLYDSGSYSKFFSALNSNGAVDRHLFEQFEKDASRWVKESAALRERRTIIAAAVALELAHLLRDKPADWAGRYLVWASKLVRQDPPQIPSAAERLWYLASVAGMEELDQPSALAWGRESGSSVLNFMSRSLGDGGQVAIALRRFPDEPRFHLARVALMEWRLWDLWGHTPSYIELARTNVGLRVPTDPRSDDDITLQMIRDTAAVTVRALAGISETIREFQALATHEAMRAEIELHVGGLESRAMRWSTALDHLRRVPDLTNEPYLLHLSQLLIGRTLHNMGDNAGAAAAFERAVRIVPNARAATTWLAAELLMSENSTDRDRAYPLLQGAYSGEGSDDPWRLYLHGDARLWSSYMAQLRQALR